MNCAPIRVSSGQDSTARIRNRREKFSKRADFPGLFLANLGPVSNGCLTHEANVDQMAIAYPNPGDSVAHPEGTKSLLQQPCDGNVRNAGFHGGAETSAPAPAPAAEEPPVTPKPKPAQPNPENEPEASQPSAENPPVIVPAPAPAVNPPNNDPATSTTCTEGHLRCNEGKTSFSTCTGGKWTNPQSLAQDTTCRLGEGEGLVVITPFDDPQIPEGLV